MAVKVRASWLNKRLVDSPLASEFNFYMQDGDDMDGGWCLFGFPLNNFMVSLYQRNGVLFTVTEGEVEEPTLPGEGVQVWTDLDVFLTYVIMAHT